MKKNVIVIIAVALMLVVALAAILLLKVGNRDVAGNNDNPQPQTGNSNPNEDLGYVFEYKGVKIAVEAESTTVLDALGEPMNYFEAPSCAFEGMDKVYTYGGFEFQTYTKGEKDYIASIHFLDDSITTPEGIGLNASLEDITKAYGTDYQQSFSQYTYTKGKCNLSFILENNEVVSVQYASVDFAGSEQQ
ncbi:MAG: hypothetical protein KBA53_02030 [Thermoclostridium sp.]|nr:hypothetical protein [Thermoclostridium sp.]